MVYKHIHGAVQGAPLPVAHGDKAEAHAHVEPFAVAGAALDLAAAVLLLRLGQLPFASCVGRESRQSERQPDTHTYIHTRHRDRWSGLKVKERTTIETIAPP